MSRLWLIPLSFLLLGADWKDSPFPNWSEDAVLRLLTDSPWAKPKSIHFTWTKRDEQPISYKDIPGADPNPTIKGGSPVGGIGAPKSKLPDKADIIIRWVSALPERHAKALYRQRDEKKDPRNVSDLIGPPEADYVLEIFGVPAVVAHQGAGSVELAARQSTWLRTKTGRTIRSNRVQVLLQGLTISILIYFPRTEPIRLEDKEIECYGNLQLFDFRERFKLSSMVYLGHLEL
jgi:hypothetical protein